MRQKIKDQTRLYEKIRANSHRGYANRSASKHRDMEYLSKNKFGAFMGYLKETLEQMNK